MSNVKSICDKREEKGSYKTQKIRIEIRTKMQCKIRMAKQRNKSN